MFKVLSKTFGILGLGLLSGCRQPGSGGCSSTQSQLGDASMVRDVEPLAPAGGYIHFDNRACTVTLIMTSADSKEIRLNAYTPQHCAGEDDLAQPKVSLSVYLPSDDGKSGGYLKNLPATDDFFDRRAQFLEEVEKLGIDAANELSRKAVLIPQLASHFYNDTEEETPTSSAFSFCMDKSTKRLTVPNSQQVCWSSLDSGVRQLTLYQSELGASKFNRIKSYLEKRKENQERAFRQVKSFADDFKVWTDRVSTIQGGNRLFNYGPFAMFLNEDVCKRLDKTDRYYSICPARPVLLGLAEKLLVERDIDGKSKSILQKLDEMGMGVRSPFFRMENIPGPNGGTRAVQTDIRDAFRDAVSGALIEKMNSGMTELGKLFEVQNDRMTPFGKHYTIATNPVFRSVSEGSRVMFGLVRSAAFFGGNNNLPAIPLSASGALRFYLPQNQSKISFNSTDSGSMITFGGIIPLLVLHTVDDKPVSGGASILALPEAQAETLPAVASKTSSTVAKNVAEKSNSASGSEVRENDYIVSPNSYIAGCR